jgi:hypothetical protein
VRLFIGTVPGIGRIGILDCWVLTAAASAMSMGFMVLLAIGIIHVGGETGFSWLELKFGRVGLRRRRVRRFGLVGCILIVPLGL